MSRVYYRESYIQETSLENPIINIADFKAITDSKKDEATTSQILKIPMISPLKFWKNKEKRFKYATVWPEEKIYNHSRLGNFYTPKSICFFDVQDYYFPSDYYFIAMIDGNLELRKCHAGEGTKWMEIADIHSPITNKILIKRMENSFEGLKEILLK